MFRAARWRGVGGTGLGGKGRVLVDSWAHYDQGARLCDADARARHVSPPPALAPPSHARLQLGHGSKRHGFFNLFCSRGPCRRAGPLNLNLFFSALRASASEGGAGGRGRVGRREDAGKGGRGAWGIARRTGGGPGARVGVRATGGAATPQRGGSGTAILFILVRVRGGKEARAKSSNDERRDWVRAGGHDVPVRK